MGNRIWSLFSPTLSDRYWLDGRRVRRFFLSTTDDTSCRIQHQLPLEPINSGHWRPGQHGVTVVAKSCTSVFADSVLTDRIILYYTVFQKVDHQLMAITLSKPNRFSKFLHRWKEEEIANRTHIIYPTTPKVCCRTTCGKLKFTFATSCTPDRLLLWCP